MSRYVLDFHEIDLAQAAVVGGKGARLGELSRIEGIQVPPGFCVTTEAFSRAIADAAELAARLDQLSRVTDEDRNAIATISAAIRRLIEEIAVPDDVAR